MSKVTPQLSDFSNLKGGHKTVMFPYTWEELKIAGVEERYLKSIKDWLEAP